MRHNPAPIVGPFYTDDTLPWSAQDTVNLLPVVAEDRGTRSQFMLKTAPGLKPWQKIGDGPIRALYTAESRLFCVSGSKTYQVTAAGIGIPLGNMPGTGRVQVAHNQIASGNEVCFVNGSSGYVYNTHTQDYSKITDDGFPGAKSVEFIDQYFMFVDPFGRYAFTSDLADGMAYNTLDRFQAESSPDRLQCASSMQGDAVLFGQRSVQFFANTGAATGTWQSKGVVIQRGAASPHCVVKIDNSIIWVGDDGVVYRLNGYSPQRISTGPVERLLAQYNLANCFAMVWEDRGFKVYYLTVIGGPTLGFHVECGTWVRRSTWTPAQDIRGRWRPSALAYFNGQWIAGDAYSGELYTMDWDYFLDRDRPLVRERVTSIVTDNQNRVVADYLELVIAGQDKHLSVPPNPLFPAQPEGPTLTGDAPDDVVGGDYSYSYTLGGGRPPYKLKVKSGTLPEGLSLAQTGVLSGIPTKAGLYEFTLRNTDQNLLFADLKDTIVIGTMLLASTASTFIPSKGRDWSSAGYYQGADMSRLIGLEDKFVCYSTVELGYTDNFGQTVTSVGTSSQNLLPGGKYLDGQVVIPCYQGTDNGFYVSPDGITYTLVSSPYAQGIAKSLGFFYTLDATKIWKSTALGGTWEAVGEHGMSTVGTQLEANDEEVRIGGSSGSGVRMLRYRNSYLSQMSLPGESNPGSVVTALYYSKRLKIWLCGTSSGSVFYDKGAGWVRADYVVPGDVTAFADNGALTVVSGQLGTGHGFESDGSIAYSSDLDSWTQAPLFTGASIGCVSALEVPDE